MFLSTPPSRVATARRQNPQQEQKVSIHATLAGGDEVGLAGGTEAAYVSIHATLAGGDAEKAVELMDNNVSIHATLAGGDDGNYVMQPDPTNVSIHATLAGGDLFLP